MSSQTPNPLDPKPIDEALAGAQPPEPQPSELQPSKLQPSELQPSEPPQTTQPEHPVEPGQQPAVPPASTLPPAPAAPQYQPPQYQAPRDPHAPQFQAPQPGQQGGGQPPYGAQPNPAAPGSGSSTTTNLQLNYWLSVFLFWIPALIFYLTERGKSPTIDKFNRDNLNFTLVRTIVGVAVWLFSGIPVLGTLVALAGSIAGLVLFVFHLIAAIKVKENYERGQGSGFVFNIDIVK